MLRRCLPWAVGILTALILLIGSPKAAFAQDKALVLRAVNSGQTAWTNYVKDRLRETGLFATVDDADMGISNPAVATLLQYKLVVAISSSYGLNDGDATGNALGTYMAMRPDGSVLLFSPYTWQTGNSITPPIGGTFAANYSLMTTSATSVNTATKLGTVVNGDPLTVGVMPFDCGTDCRRITGMTPKPGATVAASWDDGTPLAIRGRNRVDLNMYPADDAVISGSWKSGGKQLITNAILFLAGAVTATPPSVTFNPAPLGLSSAPQAITFRNGSRNAVQITAMGIDGPAASAFSVSALQTPSIATPVTVGSGDTFTANVTFKPQNPGMQAAALFINVVGLGRVNVPLSGDSRGNLLVTGAPVDFGGVALGAMPAPIRVTLKNVGTQPISLTAAPVLSNTAQFSLTPVLMTSYPLTLAPGSSYRFDVGFLPGMTAGAFMGTITINSTDVLNPLIIPVSGLAGPPALQVAYSSLVMPDAPVNGRGQPLNVLLTNNGNSDLTISEITSDNPEFIVTLPMLLTIKARQATVFQISFAPKMEGLRQGTVTIKSNEPPPAMMANSNKLITLSGSGTTPKFRVSTDKLDFGTVTIGQPATPQALTIYNDGDGDLPITSVIIQAGMNTNSFSVGNVPSRVAANSSETIQINCTPTVAGMLTAKLTVTVGLMTMNTADVTLTATANGAITDVSPKSVAFGSQKIMAAATKEITVTNSGNQPLTISSVTLTQAMGTAFAVMAPAANTKVMPGTPLKFKVTFTPPMVGDFTATLTVQTDDPTTPRFVLQLSGTGVTSSVSIMPTTLNFTSLYVGQSSMVQVVTVRNIGATPIDKIEALPPSSTQAEDAAAFQQMGMFKTSLMPGESTDIGYVFAPRVPKDNIAATVILRIDGIDQVSAKVSLAGSALSPVLNIRPMSVNFGNVIQGATAMPQEVLLTNSGAGKLAVDIADPTDEQFTLSDADGMPLTGSLNLQQDTPVRLLVTFKPTSLGSKRATVALRIKGTDIDLGAVSLVGEGVAPKTDMGGGGCSVALGQPAAVPSMGLLLLAALGLLLRRRRA